MKKPIIAMLMLATLASCKKDKPKETSPNVVGTWKMTFQQIVSGKDQSVLQTTPVLGCSREGDMIFDVNGSFILTAFSKSGDNCVRHEADDFKGSYQYNSNTKKLALTIENETVPLDVVVLTNSELRWSLPTADFNKDGVKDSEVTVFNR